MTNELVSTPEYGEIMERVLIAGDLSRLTPVERTSFYMQTCQSLGLNPLTQPFEYIKLNGKEQLYARKACTDQLRALRRLSVSVKDQSIDGDMLTVTVGVRDASGREDEDFGSVSIRGLSGEALANARMKAITKAKRRATLSFCGLGVLDETEIEDATFTVVPHQDKPKRITTDPLAPASAPSPQQTPASPEVDPPSRGALSPDTVRAKTPLSLPFLQGSVTKECTNRPQWLAMMEAAIISMDTDALLELWDANSQTMGDIQAKAKEWVDNAKPKDKPMAQEMFDRCAAIYNQIHELNKARNYDVVE